MPIRQRELEQQFLHEGTLIQTLPSLLYLCSCRITHPIEEFDTTDRHSRSTLSEQGASASLMPRSALPRIKLLSFSGDYASWKSFYDLFVLWTRDNPALTNVERMHYLKTCVTGEAAQLVGNLFISGDNFSIAWNLLVSRYENKWFLIAAQFDRITNLKLSRRRKRPRPSKSSNQYLRAIAVLRSLGCAVNSWDPLLLSSPHCKVARSWISRGVGS